MTINQSIVYDFRGSGVEDTSPPRPRRISKTLFRESGTWTWYPHFTVLQNSAYSTLDFRSFIVILNSMSFFIKRIVSSIIFSVFFTCASLIIFSLLCLIEYCLVSYFCSMLRHFKNWLKCFEIVFKFQMKFFMSLESTYLLKFWKIFILITLAFNRSR